MVAAAILLASADEDIDGTPVPLLPWDSEQTLIEWQIGELQAAGVEVVEVVLGDAADRVIPLVARDNVEPILDTGWEHGDGIGALRVGATATPRDTHLALVVDVRQPVSTGSARLLLDAAARSGATVTCIASLGLTAPVVVDRSVLTELRNAREPLQAILGRHADSVHTVPSGGPPMPRVESRESYGAARRILGLP